MNVVQGEWMAELSSRRLPPRAIMRLKLLESDLKSLRISLEAYIAAKNEVDAEMIAMASDHVEIANHLSIELALSPMFHHAKVFVVCMRRFSRILEATRSRKHEYPQDVGEVIALTWKKTKSFFDDYREARDAIEHIDGEINGHNWKFLNLWGDSFEVVDGKCADITPMALETAERAWSEILEVIMRPAEARVRTFLIKRFLLLVQARVDRLNSVGIASNLRVEPTTSIRV